VKNLFGEANLKKGDKPHLTYVTLGQLIDYWNDEVIVKYGNNRGNVGVNEDNVQRIIDDFDADALGMFYVAQSPGGQYEMVDAHTRREAVLRMVFDNDERVEGAALTTELPLKIVADADFMKFYRLLNRNAAHSTNMKTTNPDFALGHFVTVLLKRLGEDARDWPAKRINALIVMAIAYDMALEEGTPFTYINITKRRYDKIKEYQEMPAGSFKISPEAQTALENALQEYLEFRKEISEEIQLTNSKTDKSRLKSLIEGDPSLGFFYGKMIDSLSDEPLLTKTSRVFDKAVTNGAELAIACKNIAKLSRENASFVRFYHLLGVSKREAERRGKLLNPEDLVLAA
jgi:hypothetical protein